MTYDVYAGGFHVVEATLDVDLSKAARYDLELSAKTRGFLGSLAPWEGTFETHGWHDGKTKKAQPELHKSTTIWSDELEVKEYSYNKDGSFGQYSIKDHEGNDGVKEVDAELTKDTTDALTATLEVMQKLADGGNCEGAHEVFDGKRRYKLAFKHKQDVMLESTRYNVYEGPATECIVETIPLKGQWHKKPRGWMSIQEQSRDNGRLPTIWLAQLAEGEPAVPVKIMVKTDYGVLFMHLTGYRHGQEVKYAKNEED